jgi:3-oxoacyl-[acyl-carrier-protein] synthase-3
MSASHPAAAHTVWLRACCAYVPEQRVPIEDAIANGWYAMADHAKDDYAAIAVEDTKWPAEMARDVGQAALRAAGIAGDAVGLLVHTAIHRHGHARLWQPAAYLQTQLDAADAMAFSLSHGCNGLFIAVQLALDFLYKPDARDALLIGADRFGTSVLDRWQGDYGVLYGDAAVAVLLSNTRGFARVRHCAVASVPALEGMHRGGAEHVESGVDPAREYAIRDSKRAFMVRHGRDYFFTEIRNALLRLRADLLEHCDLLAAPADWLITPNVGHAIAAPLYAGIFAELAQRHYRDMGRHIGHTGTADQFVSLTGLMADRLLVPGQRVLLIGAGAGFSCSALLLEVENNHIEEVNHG